jgi:hypothetical protein
MVAVSRRIHDQDPGSSLANGESATVKQIIIELVKKLIRFGIRALVFTAVFSVLMVRVIRSSASRRTSMNAATIALRPRPYNITNYYSTQRKMVSDRPRNQTGPQWLGDDKQMPGMTQGAQPTSQGLLQGQAGIIGSQQQANGGLLSAGVAAGGVPSSNGGTSVGILGASSGAVGGILGAGGGADGGTLGASGASGGILGAGGGGILGASGETTGGVIGAGSILGATGGAGGGAGGGLLGGGGGLGADMQQNGNLIASKESIATQSNGLLVGQQQLPKINKPAIGATMEKNGGKVLGNQALQLGQGKASHGHLQSLPLDLTSQSVNEVPRGERTSNAAANRAESAGDRLVAQNFVNASLGGNKIGGSARTTPASGSTVLDSSKLEPAALKTAKLAGNLGSINEAGNADGQTGNLKQGLQSGGGITIGQTDNAYGQMGSLRQGLQLGGGIKTGQEQQGGQATEGQQFEAGSQEEDAAQNSVGGHTSSHGSKNSGTPSFNSLKSPKLEESDGVEPTESHKAVKSGTLSGNGGQSRQGFQNSGSLGQTQDQAEDVADDGGHRSGRGASLGSPRLASSSMKSQAGAAGSSKLRGTASQDAAEGQEDDSGRGTHSGVGGRGKITQTGKISSRGASSSGLQGAKTRNSGQSSSSNIRASAGREDSEETSSNSFSNARSSSSSLSGSTSKGSKSFSKLRGSGVSRSN